MLRFFEGLEGKKFYCEEITITDNAVYLYCPLWLQKDTIDQQLFGKQTKGRRDNKILENNIWIYKNSASNSIKIRNKNLIVTQSIEIGTDKLKVWITLTNPEKIKIYLLRTLTDWKRDVKLPLLKRNI